MRPQNVMLDTIGYLKASNLEANDAFGGNVVLSSDGFTLAVTASGESSGATASTATRPTTARPTPAPSMSSAAAAMTGNRRHTSRLA
jgi:hypothetical protein